VKEALVLTWVACAMWAGFWCCSARPAYPSETEEMYNKDGGVIHIYVCHGGPEGCEPDNSGTVLVPK
jgi:hypothetical protein